MKINLLHSTPLYIASTAIRKCWDSGDKSDTCNTNNSIGSNDRALIHRVGNKFKHASTLEHLTYNFDIDGVSRALLQELARHRIASYSVKSTRYTLKELKDEKLLPILTLGEPLDTPIWESKGWPIASKYLVSTGDEDVDRASYQALISLQLLLRRGISNDKAKYCLPEAYKTELSWTINARSLQNFLSLRINHKHALREIVQLAENIALALPNDHKYLYKDIIEEFASPEFKEVFIKSMV